MTSDALTERRRWFRVFPEGTAEFLIVTRVPAVLLMAALSVIYSAQMHYFLLGIVGMLWLDHLLLTWWLVSIRCDLDDLAASEPTSAKAAQMRRVRLAMILALPSIPAFLLIAPWENVVFTLESTRNSVQYVLWPVLLILFTACLVVAKRAIKTRRLNKELPWLTGFLIPGVHLLALHRLLRRLHQDVRHSPRDEPPHLAIGIGNVCWVFSMILWGLYVVFVALGDGFESRAVHALTTLAGAFFFGVLASAQLAAIEAVQRLFVAKLRA